MLWRIYRRWRDTADTRRIWQRVGLSPGMM
jgi:hypothetical protein